MKVIRANEFNSDTKKKISKIFVDGFFHTNMKAVKLYEKLGYSEFLRIRQKHSKQIGVNNLVYMKILKNNN